MSKQLNRKPLMVNQRRGIKQEFQYVEGGYKADAQPSIVTWKAPGRGTKGESVNSSGDVGSRQIVNRNWKAI
jgi:hypothetical protein